MTDEWDEPGFVDASACGGIVGAAECCPRCGTLYRIGEWPLCGPRQDHGKSVQLQPFAEYFDIGLGRTIRSLGDRWAAMRAERLDYREKMSPGQLSARRDRIEERKKAEGRA